MDKMVNKTPDNDLDDDFGPVEPDTDFGEFDQKPNGSSTLADLWKNNPIVKIGLIAAAFIVIVGGIMMFGGSSTEPPASNVAAGRDLKQTPGTEDVSPAMREALEENNQQRLEEAVKQGTSVLPTPIDAPRARLPVPTEEVATEDPLLRWRQLQEERLRTQQQQEIAQAAAQPVAPDPAAEQQLANLTTAMTTQMNQILGGKTPKNLSYMEVTNMDQFYQQMAMMQQQEAAAAMTPDLAALAMNASLQQGGGGPIIDPRTGQPMAPKILIPAGSVEYGQLLLEANSDVPGPVLAMMASGPFSGSRILGSFSRQQDYLVIQFNTLISKDGVSIPVQAFAVDPKTTLTGVATEVDQRYWKRVILPAAAEFIQGLGEAVSESGTTVTVNNGTVTESKDEVDVEEQLYKGLERGADRLGQVLDQEAAQTQVLVRVKAGAAVGILFMAPVTDQDREASRFNQQTALQQRQQQQQQQQFLQQMQVQQQGGANNAAQQLMLLQALQGGLQGAAQGATQGIPGLNQLGQGQSQNPTR
jgi:intracellular multiplication protein IcmE